MTIMGDRDATNATHHETQQQGNETMGLTTIKNKLRTMGVEITSCTPWSDLEDAAIYLGGEYEGIHVSIGQGYYSVVRECSETDFVFIDGEGNLKSELKEALASI
jgi:hypothetical protein